MSDDRPTNRPPRPSTKRFVASGADSSRANDAQRNLLEDLRVALAVRTGQFFEDAAEDVRTALLTAGLGLYQDGEKRGREQAALLFQSYLDLLDEGYAKCVRDPRAEVARPAVTCAQLRAALLARGFDALEAEVRELCLRVGVPLAPEE